MSVHWKIEKRRSGERHCKNCNQRTLEYRGFEAVLYHAHSGSAYCHPKAPWPRKHAE